MKELATTNTPQKEVYNSNEAAAFLGITKIALYSLTRTRQIAYYKPGKRMFFKHADLLAYLERGRVMTAAELDAECARRTMN